MIKGADMAGTVVVGVDGSGPSLLAVRWAVREADLVGAGLSVCCVAIEDARGRPMLWTSPQLVRRDATDIAEQAVDQAADECADVDVSVNVVVGDVVPALTAAAAGSDLLVVGCRGLGAFSGLLLGSVSERLVRHPPGPVVVVRGNSSAWAGPVLVGVDDAPETARAVEFAAAAADRRRVPLVALTAAPPVWPAPPAAFPVESASSSDGVMAVLRDVQEDGLGPALAHHPSVSVEHRTMLAGAASSLIEASSGCGLVVVGAGRSGLLGSVAGHVVRHAACPVAVV
ncbi:MAG TPA: universal stress protein, partial [Mycobacteriales bacterium]